MWKVATLSLIVKLIFLINFYDILASVMSSAMHDLVGKYI